MNIDFLDGESARNNSVGYINTIYTINSPYTQAYWREARLNNRFYAGNQDAYSWFANFPFYNDSGFFFNHIRSVINRITGQQIQNRTTTIAEPLTNGDSLTAEQYTKCLLSVYNTDNFADTISDGFRGGCIAGMNLLQLWLDYTNDPINGTFRLANHDYASFMIDPFFRKLDLSDCRYISTRNYVTKRQAAHMMPDRYDDIMKMPYPNGRQPDIRFEYMPENYNRPAKNLLTYDELYYQDYRERLLLIDRETGEMTEYRGTDDDMFREYLYLHPSLTAQKDTIPTVRLAIVINNEEFYNGPQPIRGLDCYPHTPIFTYYNKEEPALGSRIQSLVTDLRAPQMLYNRFRLLEMNQFETRTLSAWVYKEDALVDPADVYKQAGQGKGIALKSSAQMTDVQQIVAPDLPPTMIALTEQLGKEINQISSLSEETLGVSTQDVAASLTALRARFSLTGYEGVFNNLRLAEKLIGEKVMTGIIHNFTPQKVKMMLEGQEATPQFFNPVFDAYHCVIKEGINTPTQRQMTFNQLIQLQQAKIPVPPQLLMEYCPIENKSEIIAQMNQERQQQQQQVQQQQQIAMMQAQAAAQEAQARIQLAQARAQADMGLGIERLSRVEENRALAVERRAAAVRDEDQAILNLAKTLKELDSVDLAHLEKLIMLSRIVEQQNAPQEQPQSLPGIVQGNPIEEGATNGA